MGCECKKKTEALSRVQKTDTTKQERWCFDKFNELVSLQSKSKALLGSKPTDTLLKEVSLKLDKWVEKFTIECPPQEDFREFSNLINNEYTEYFKK